MSNSELRRIFTTGVPKSASPEVGVRLEIHTLLANPQLRNLYLLGLESFQNRNENDPRSWYQIGGIHGAPYTAWNGETAASGMGTWGYCAHSSHIFLSWHRAYLALFEQTLFNDVMEVAKQYDNPEIEKLAEGFRAPYWDWVEEPILSKDITNPLVSVRRPGATRDEQIPNPLACYKFHYTDVPARSIGSWGSRPTTIRWPSNNTPQAVDQVEQMTRRLEQFITTRPFGSNLNLRDRLFMLLNIEQRLPGQSFRAFSSDQWESNGRSSDYASAESLHDSLHVELGSHRTLRTRGHMIDPSVAGFDPIFWLHHCNVDRIWALWQAIHEREDANWNIREGADGDVPWAQRGTVITENTGLLPFRKNSTSLWTSKDIKYPAIFNATYPELTTWTPTADRRTVSREVTAIVRLLYGPQTSNDRIASAIQAAAIDPTGLFTVNAVALTPVALTAEPTSVAALVKGKAQEVLAVASSKTEMPPTFTSVTPPEGISTAEIPLEKVVINPTASAGKTTHREYFANIRAHKFAFGGSFSIHVFIGQFTSDAKARPTDPNLVGSVNVFASDVNTSHCENCLEGYDKGLVITGQVPLTSALLDRIELVGSLEKEDVTPFLREHLHWRLHREDENHTSISRSELPHPDDLVFSVTSCLVDVPDAADELVVYYDWNPIPEITEGRPTGTGFDDTEGYEAPSEEYR
ncbi:Di-copper centre-containing protein [Ascodesmis nigricans]|uniref:tyrosinase n=1 Tax=Ascodesmis nigricans TaxID=341454 RepID=A0A4S2MTZ1_9PEZI|nr:Di-copper centre-containing protein [Ascodesmis nigricans]